MPSPTVSVIIPAYKASGTIARALNSLLGQTRLPDEIIVVDDGSPEDLEAVLSPYGPRVTLLHKANGGAASARNHGIDHARGDLLAFLDADDYVEPAKIERQVELLERHPEVGLCASRFFVEFPETGLRQLISPESAVAANRVLRPVGADVFAAASNLWTTAVMVRRSFLGNHRFDTRLKTAEDIDLWLRLVQTGPIYVLGEALATQVLVSGSLSRSDVEMDSVNMLEVIRRHADLLGRAGRRYWEARVYRNWAAGHLGAGERRKALLPAWRRWLRQPWRPQAWWILLKSAAVATKSV